MVQISSDLPAGNIRELSQNGNTIYLQEEQRDSRNEWFYWKFKAVFEVPGIYRFIFPGCKIGTRGAAVSLDQGVTWKWQTGTLHKDDKSFSFECKAPGEVWFCQGIPYLQGELDRFMNEFRDDRRFKVSELCRSREGRPVELITIQEENSNTAPLPAILLTSRHHCQEMAATHALEGIFRAVLADDAFGCAFRKQFRLFAVPFVDKDGVENGDQGKGRIPRDHGRDYYKDSIYPETAAIRSLIEREKPFFVLDMHCPWLRYDVANETSYLVENKNTVQHCEAERFARILESNAPDCAPFFAKNTNRYGVGWNTSANAGTGEAFGCGIATFALEHPFVQYASTIEIPFANFGERTVVRYELLQFGKAIAKSILQYCRREDGKEAVTLCFTGDVMLENKMLKACRKENGDFDFSEPFLRIRENLKSDYTVGNLETPFAGPKAGFTNALYSFNTPDSFADAVAQAGFRLVSTANNHCLDRGVDGLKRTLTILDRAGVEHVGTARSREEREKVFLRDVCGFKVAFVCSTYGTNAFANNTFLQPEEECLVNLSQPQETLPGSVHLLNSMEQIGKDTAALPCGETKYLAEIRSDVRKAKEAGAEYVIVLMHSGGQYNPEPDHYTEMLVGKLCEYGADMIVGNHPHVIQKFAMKGSVPVFYCLGNLLCDPIGSPEGMKHPFHANSIVVKPVLSRENGRVFMKTCEFQVMRSILLADGRNTVVPLFDLIESAADEEQKKLLTEDLQKSVRIFKDLPSGAEIPVQAVYRLK